MKNQQLQLLAIRIPVFGLKEQPHILRHQLKLNRCPLDAGIDLIPSSIDTVIIYEGWSEVRVGTKIHMQFGPGSYGRITDRSSTSKETGGATVLPGVIDAGYTGEIIIRLQCLHGRFQGVDQDTWFGPDVIFPIRVALDRCIKDQIPVAQIIPSNTFMGIMESVNPNSIPNLGRGNNGFGSTNDLKS